jgi:lysozyme
MANEQTPQNAPEGPQKGWNRARKGTTWVTIAAACIGGYEGCKNYAYRDPVGIPTICFGATSDVNMGDYKSTADCKALLISDIYKHKAALDAPDCIGSEVMDRLPAKVEAAVVSIVFNTGPGKKGVKDGICHLKHTGERSTMAKFLIAGKLTEACHEFPKWANPPLPGIIKRRNDEMRICLEGVAESQQLETTE